MARTVEEVGVAKGDVRRPRLDLLADVREHHVPRHDEETPGVDGRDRAVPAEVLAAAGRLDVSRELEPAVLVDVRVLLRRRQLRPARHREVELLEDRAGGRRLALRLELRCELDQGGIGFAAQDGVGDAGQEILGVEGRVEAIEREVTGGVHGPRPLGDGDAEAERRVHWDGDRDEARPAHLLGIERLDGDVQQGRAISPALEERRRPGDGQRLVAELVTGDEEDLPRLFHALSVRLGGTLWAQANPRGGLVTCPSRSPPGRTVLTWSRGTWSCTTRPARKWRRPGSRGSRCAAAATRARSRCATGPTARSASRRRSPRRSSR